MTRHLMTWFFSNTSAKWAIFNLQFDKLNGPSQAKITFFATKKLMNIIIQPKDFLPNGRLAHIYIPNNLYIPVTLMDALDIRHLSKQHYVFQQALLHLVKS